MFLDRCVIDLYKECEAVRVKKYDEIQRMKEKIGKIEEEYEDEEMEELTGEGVMNEA